MKIIIVDRLNYPFGGTQKYVFSLIKLLQQNQNEVYLYNGKKIITNYDSHNFSFDPPKINLFQKFESIYSISNLIRSLFIFKEIKPDIIHLHNINYLITPSIIHAAKILKIPIIAHLHDYKLICPKSTLINNKNQSCRQCQNQNYFSILKNNCNRNNQKNFFESLFLFFENVTHYKILNVYKNISCFVSPSHFLKNTFTQMGFPFPIEVINNFTFLKQNKISKPSNKKNKIIYFGRLSPEKGLIELCKSIKNVNIKLTIIGSGPLQKKLKQISLKQKNIKILPFMSEKNLIKTIQKNDFTITPSVWPENASISIIESFALAKPVIGNNIGGIPEMISKSKNGFLFSHNDSKSINKVLKKVLIISDKKYSQMSQLSLKNYKENYSPSICYHSLTDLYKKHITSPKNVI